METELVYTFKVKLKFAKKIWRKIAIRGDQTLEDLHHAIFRAFDRYDEHLYAFYKTRNVNSTSQTRLKNVPQYTNAIALDGFSSNTYDAAKTPISSLKMKERSTLEYLFDFGDEWWHILELESMSERKTGAAKYPEIIEKKGKSPDQYPEYE